MIKTRETGSMKVAPCRALFCLYSLLKSAMVAVALFGATLALADDAVRLKVLVVSARSETEDQQLAYITPILEEMKVPYDVLDASTTSLTAAVLSPNGCTAATTACIGNYNGIILTSTDLDLNFTPVEWEVLHQYERDFQVREAVLSGWPGQYWDPDPPRGIYLDYGLEVSAGGSFPNVQWTKATDVQPVFDYVNTANPLPVLDFAFAATPRVYGENSAVPRDGTIPRVEPLLVTANGEALVSIVRYYLPGQSEPEREVFLSTISNAWFLIHSQVLAYEFINFATKGVFVGGRYVYMSTHLDDLFMADELWNPEENITEANELYRLNSLDIFNAVASQSGFKVAHQTADITFKLDFPFNGVGAVVDPDAAEESLTADLNEDLVAAVITDKSAFRFINHTYSHADMDNSPESPDAICDYDTLPSIELIKEEITRNRVVWNLLDLPEKNENLRVLVSGNHSGLKDRKCTDYPELHPEMANVLDDDVEFWQGANPLFLAAAAETGVDFLASDSSQLNQNVEQYISQVDDGSEQDRIMLPRWPTNIFYNTITPYQLTDEYNYIFYERYLNNDQDPCAIPGAICSARNYQEILDAEAETAIRHMLSYKKWAHYFHQSNLADYGAGRTLMFDWLHVVFDEYERLLVLPVKNLPYYTLGEKTEQSLIARSASIQAVWNRTTNTVTLAADKAVPKLMVTGLEGGDLYGGQFIREVDVDTTPITVTVANDPLPGRFASECFAIRRQLQSVIDDPGTPSKVAEDLNNKVLQKVNEAFKEFLKGHPHHLGDDLKEAIKVLKHITDDRGFDTLSLQADIALLTVKELERLIDRVGAITGALYDDLLAAEDRLVAALTAFTAGDYELTAEHARKGAEEIKDPKYMGNFCSDATGDVYYSRLCNIQEIRDEVDTLFETYPQDGKLKDARDRLRDGLRKLAVNDVKEAAKKCREAGEKLTEVKVVDVTTLLEKLTAEKSGVAGLVAQYLTDAKVSAHDLKDLYEAQVFYDMGKAAYGDFDYISALLNFEKAADKAKP